MLSRAALADLRRPQPAHETIARHIAGIDLLHKLAWKPGGRAFPRHAPGVKVEADKRVELVLLQRRLDRAVDALFVFAKIGAENLNGPVNGRLYARRHGLAHLCRGNTTSSRRMTNAKRPNAYAVLVGRGNNAFVLCNFQDAFITRPHC